MPAKKNSPAHRKPRADAQRNRALILEVAREVFTRDGVTASLDEIARQAGVGPGTLYRHFPTREDLLANVYHSQVEKLVQAEKEYARTLPPLEALRAWMVLFVDYIATKHILVPALTSAEKTSSLFRSSGTLIMRAIHDLAGRAVKSGDLRSDVDPMDLLRAIMGVSSVLPNSDWPQRAKQLVDVLLLGSRPVK